MIKFLLLGFSSIAHRRVLPALASLGIEHVDVASRSAAGEIKLPSVQKGAIFDDYQTALRQSEAEVVYISTVNSLHAELAAEAISNGRHVIIDKPATTSLADTKRLISLAQEKDRLLAEATVYDFHPQIAAAQAVFSEIGSQPTRIMASFSFPRLPTNNFRYDKDLGGGALLDLGPYAVTPGRVFFKAAPLDIICRKFNESEDNVESGFSLLATYPGNRSFVGQYGMGTGYINQMHVLGPDTTVALDRVFSPPADLVCELKVNQKNMRQSLTVAPADTFANFIEAVLTAIQQNNLEAFTDVILADATALDRLRS